MVSHASHGKQGERKPVHGTGFRGAYAYRRHKVQLSWPHPSSISASKQDPTLPATTSLGATYMQSTFYHAKRWTTDPAPPFCCHGRVKLAPLGMSPGPLEVGPWQDQCIQAFPTAHAKYSSDFMASSGCHQIRESGWNPTFNIQGQVCHNMGALCPMSTEAPQFTQTYSWTAVE